MSIFTKGRVCMKLAGRDAGKACVVVESVDDKFVVVDGETRRRKVNVAHLEATEKMVDVGNGDSAGVAKAFSGLGLKVRISKPRKAVTRVVKVKAKKQKAAPVVKKKEAKKATTKSTEKPEVKAENKVKAEPKVDVAEKKEVKSAAVKAEEKVADKPTEKEAAKDTVAQKSATTPAKE